VTDINHSATADTRDERRRRSIATSFVRDADFEALLAVKAEAGSNPVAAARYESLDPQTRTAFGSYQAARAAAIAEGIIGSDGQAK
jgi:hypothetical protein